MTARILRWTLGAAVVFGALAALGIAKGEAWPLWAAGVGFCATLFFGLRRPLARHRAEEAPLRPAIEASLDKHVAQFRELEGDERTAFLRRVQVLIDTLVFEAVKGAEFDEETKALAVAGAAILVQGRPDYEFATTRSVLLYPDHFDTEYEIDSKHEVAGMVHRQGPIIFSRRALQSGWARGKDAHNVSIHEWAHVLDFDDGFADGVPGFATDLERWNEVLDDELERARKRKNTALRPYAGTNRAETFAVAMECFFERPRALRRKNNDFYELLVKAFRIRPLDEDDE